MREICIHINFCKVAFGPFNSNIAIPLDIATIWFVIAIIDFYFLFIGAVANQAESIDNTVRG